jgi:hypothetical protein
VGYSFAKASDVSEITLTWSNDYRTERNFIDIKLDGALIDKPDKTARRATVEADFMRLLRGKWSGTASASVERNDELGLARRFLGVLETGVTPIKGNRNTLLLSGGIAVNSELAADESEVSTSMEWSLTASYSLFDYDTPETTIDLKIDAYPGITEKGRYRIDFDARLRREIIKDFFFDLTYYLNFDSDAVSGEGEKKDYGIATSIGYSY